MLKMYAIPPSLYAAKLRIALRHKELTWDEEPPPGGYGSDTYKQIVPSGNIPTLFHDDLMITDSEAAIEYLEETFDGPALLPADPVDRVHVRILSRFHDTRLEPEVRKLFPWIKKGEGMPAGFVEDQQRHLTQRLEQLGRMITDMPHPTDRPLYLCDCGYPITFVWIVVIERAFDIRIPIPDAVAAWRAAIEEKDAVRTELDSYRRAIGTWLTQAPPQ